MCEAQKSCSSPPSIVYHPAVIKRFYVHNFRCLENFELPVAGLSSALLIGKNGSGKTTVSFALEVLQKIANGTNLVGDLVKPKDFAFGRASAPMRFEIEVMLEAATYSYTVAFEFLEGLKDLRLFDEKLSVDGNPLYSRDHAEVHFASRGKEASASFPMDLDLVTLPIVHERSSSDPVFIFKQWLARMLILRPIPSMIGGRSDSKDETLQPLPLVTNLGGWFSGLLASAPSAYTRVDGYLKQLMPDLKDIKNPLVGADARNLVVQFSNTLGNVRLPFEDLSDGEKCSMIYALVLAANEAYGPLFCFWDEPDNYIALSEVQHYVMALRTAFRAGGQFIATSHNPETIRSFSDENTFLLYRDSHLEPTKVRPVSELRAGGNIVGDLAQALVQDDIET